MKRHLISGTMRARYELPTRASSDICAEDLVRIVQIGNNQIELGEIIHQFFSQFSVPRKEACQGSRSDGFHTVRQPASESQLGNVRITENLQISVWKML